RRADARPSRVLVFRDDRDHCHLDHRVAVVDLVRRDRLALGSGPQPYSLTQTFFASVKKSSESNPPSRPTPLSFIPPKGTRRSRSSHVLTHTVPLSIAAATRCAFWRSRVQTLADSP